MCPHTSDTTVNVSSYHGTCVVVHLCDLQGCRTAAWACSTGKPLYICPHNSDTNVSANASSYHCMRLLGHAVVPANFLDCRILGDAIYHYLSVWPHTTVYVYSLQGCSWATSASSTGKPLGLPRTLLRCRRALSVYLLY